MAAGACCLAVLTGCPWDDDDDDLLPTQWQVEWYGEDEGDLTLVLEWSNLNNVGDYGQNYDEYRVDIVRSGSTITITIEDTTVDPFVITLMGTIADDGQSAEGTYEGTSSSGNEINGGWEIYAK